VNAGCSIRASEDRAERLILVVSVIDALANCPDDIPSLTDEVSRVAGQPERNDRVVLGKLGERWVGCE